MWPNPQETTELVTFTKEIYNEKLYFFCSGSYNFQHNKLAVTTKLAVLTWQKLVIFLDY